MTGATNQPTPAAPSCNSGFRIKPELRNRDDLYWDRELWSHSTRALWTTLDHLAQAAAYHAAGGTDAGLSTKRERAFVTGALAN
jgi:hypothetical protein